MLTSRIRVIDLETAGGGPHDVCEIGGQDVSFGSDGCWRVDQERGALFVNPARSISPDTMAIHHIRDVDVAGSPFWKDIAPSVLRPEGGAVALAAHRAGFQQRYCKPRLSGGASWLCTCKCGLQLWPDVPRSSKQLLRYQRMPEGLVHEIGLQAHRAMPDAYVTAHHRRDMLNQASLGQLLAWSGEPGLLPRMPTGPDRGKSWAQIGIGALRDLARDHDINLRYSAETELARRGDRDDVAPNEPAQALLL